MLIFKWLKNKVKLYRNSSIEKYSPSFWRWAGKNNMSGRANFSFYEFTKNERAIDKITLMATVEDLVW